MLRMVLFLCAALAAMGADDPWAKVKTLKSGYELRVYKRGSAQPLLVKFGELTDENLIVINKTEEMAIPRDQIDRIDSRASAKRPMTRETKASTTATDGSPGTSNSGTVSWGSRPDFETVYRRPAPAPAKK
jgi:hypothetical protein